MEPKTLTYKAYNQIMDLTSSWLDRLTDHNRTLQSEVELSITGNPEASKTGNGGYIVRYRAVHILRPTLRPSSGFQTAVKMYSSILYILVCLAAAVIARPLDAKHDDLSSLYEELLVPEDFSSKSFVFGVVIDSDWDMNDLTVNSTCRDSATAFNPIVGKANVGNSYNIRTQFCTRKISSERSGTFMLLSHGLATGREYVFVSCGPSAWLTL